MRLAIVYCFGAVKSSNGSDAFFADVDVRTASTFVGSSEDWLHSCELIREHLEVTMRVREAYT